MKTVAYITSNHENNLLKLKCCSVRKGIISTNSSINSRRRSLQLQVST